METHDRYNSWWVGRLIKRVNATVLDPPRLCIRLEFVGPPSFTYGYIVMHFIDGTSMDVEREGHVRPCKKFVDVINDPQQSVAQLREANEEFTARVVEYVSSLPEATQARIVEALEESSCDHSRRDSRTVSPDEGNR